MFKLKGSGFTSVRQHLRQPNFDPYVQVHISRNTKAKLMILGINLYLGMNNKVLSVFDLDLYLTIH